MLQLQGLTLLAGTKVLLDQASVTIKHGRKVALIGANGSGKSTLFRAILGEVAEDAGELQLQGNSEIAHVKQETPSSERSASDYVLDGDEKYRWLERAIEDEPDPIKKAQYLAEFEHIDGYSAEARAAQLLHGLGFSQEQVHQPVNSFSGGWRMRLNLAQALMKPSNLLLLDEPTNHLDLDAVLWLESWLQRYQGTLLLISHDRAFIDSVCSDIIHLYQQKLTIYHGNYSDFEKAFAEKLALQQNTREKQLKKAAHLQSFIDRFSAKASKAKQAQSRVKALEKLKVAEAVRVDSALTFSFANPDKLPDPILTLEHAELGYPDKTILNQVDLTIKPGDRIALLGRNGAGKSTLIKSLAKQLAAKAGSLHFSSTAQVGYFAQHQLELLHGEHTPLEEMALLAPEATEQELRNYLGRFRFSGDRIDQKVIQFSGGEKARLVLALLIWQKPNLLLMDEPTNHLDLETREALTSALQEFQGAIVLVSHDRFLIEAVCDQLMLVHQGQLDLFDGDLDDYAKWLKNSDKPNKSTQTVDAVSDKKTSRQQAAQKREALRPYKKKVDKLEQQMDLINDQIADVEQQLADPALYQGDAGEQVSLLNKQQNQLQQELQALESEYLDALEILEQAENDY